MLKSTSAEKVIASSRHQVQASDQRQLIIPHLALLLHRAAELALSLPHQAAVIFVQNVKQELAEITSFDTEVVRMVKQRVGQDTFRQALFDYWGGSCAVTSINLPEVLRASHAKPWADCYSDQERLNVFNGFLLVANLDTLFDRGLISFAESGEVICSTRLKASQRFRPAIDR